MLFPSPEFLFAFLPLVLLGAHGARLLARLVGRSGVGAANLVLLASSLAFYAFGEGRLVLLMLASIAGNWTFGLLVDRARGTPAAKAWVAAAVAFGVGLLVWFKYAGFAVGTAGALAEAFGGSAFAWQEVALPIGVSFFTFQALSYVIDVYRGDAAAQRNPLRFAVYVSLFPQLVAGPIVRYRDVAEQLVARTVPWSGFAAGARRFAIGLAKKVLVADTCGAAADAVFGTSTAAGVPVEGLTPALAWLAAVAYTLQIYFDFSGYSDMAIGLGRMLGFRFLENFRWPYVAASVTDFWRRWHVSLSTWFRDYLYIPLGGNRGGRGRTYRNLLVVFLLCGLWHGASWTFVVWGLYHGVFLVAERVGLGPRVARAPAPLRHVYVLLVVVVGWVFFRAETFSQAAGFLRAMAGLNAGDAARYPVALVLDHALVLALALGAVGATPWLPALRRWRAARPGAWPLELAGGAALGALLFVSACFVAADTYSPFIYFRF